MAEHYDLVIENGQVIDPAAGYHGRCAIGISGCKVAAVSQKSLSGACTIDAAGCLVTPGLIDFHTHLFAGGSEYGIRPDFLLSQGVTAAVDAGTSGSAGFEAFYRSVIQPSTVTVKAFLSLGATGLCDPNHHQNYARERVNRRRIRQLWDLYPDTLLGLKVSMSKKDVGALGLEPLHTALELAGERDNLRVCVHSTDPPCDSGELLAPLRAGDILCHCYHAAGSGILDEQGMVQPAYWEARKRGVIFDAANGISHFSHRSAISAMDNGFFPDVISSDMVSFAYGQSRRNRSLPYVMSKFLALGMPLTQIIQAATQTPAALMGMEGRIGTLAPGAFADVAIFRLEECPVNFEDAMQTYFRGEALLCPQMTIKNGQIVFFQNNFNL